MVGSAGSIKPAPLSHGRYRPNTASKARWIASVFQAIGLLKPIFRNRISDSVLKWLARLPSLIHHGTNHRQVLAFLRETPRRPPYATCRAFLSRASVLFESCPKPIVLVRGI